MTIKDFKERTSVRNYTDQKLTDQQMKDLVEAINNSPTTNNSQPFSVVIITEQEGKDIISTTNGGQDWIKKSAGILVFLGDTTRNEHLVPRSKDANILENYKDRLIIDATIASAYAQDALISMGFGSCYIGGLTRDPEAVTKLLNLPDTAFIVTAMSYGVAESTNAHKPKVNKVFMNKYNVEQAIEDVIKYNPEMKKYYETRGQDRAFEDQLKSGANPEAWKGKEFIASAKYYRKIADRYKK